MTDRENIQVVNQGTTILAIWTMLRSIGQYRQNKIEICWLGFVRMGLEYIWLWWGLPAWLYMDNPYPACYIC